VSGISIGPRPFQDVSSNYYRSINATVMGRELRLHIHRKSVHIKLSRIHFMFSVNNVW